MTDYFKVLNYDGSPYHGGRGKWTKGRWRSVRGRLVPCHNGLHLCTFDQLPWWLGPTIWKAEVHPDSEIIEDVDKVVVRKARIVEQLPWDGRTARLFASDCAEHVLHIFETEFPGDNRPRRAIEAARAYANEEIEEEELEAARNDAWDAAEDSAGYAAEEAAWAAYWAAGIPAAVYGEASRAACAASCAVAHAAVSATPALVACWTADSAAGRERSWQAERLANYLGVNS